MDDFRGEFINSYISYIQRDGADRLLKWLEGTDFFTAPASTRHHLAREGGLLEHSLNVWKRFDALVRHEAGASGAGSAFYEVSNETVAVCGLLHDICKADFYSTELRNAKDERGQWVKVPYYAVSDQVPYGHGEKSVYIASGFMRLSREEAMAIRWHMGGFDDTVKGGGYSMSEAWGKYPLAVLLHVADLQATYIDESTNGRSE